MKSTLAQHEFLIECGAANIKHSGRTLLEHLDGTAKLLRAWKQPEYVIAAGLFHSIYGTKQFKRAALDITQRGRVCEVIGDRAERLAFAFGHMERPQSLFYRDNYESIGLMLDCVDYWDLQEIEAANLLEQGSTSRWLAKLLTCDISDAAKAAITDHIKRDAVQREAS